MSTILFLALALRTTIVDPSLLSDYTQALLNWDLCPNIKQVRMCIEAECEEFQIKGLAANYDPTTKTIVVGPVYLKEGELESLLTHEIGHALGLSDTPLERAVMGYDWTPPIIKKPLQYELELAKENGLGACI